MSNKMKFNLGYIDEFLIKTTDRKIYDLFICPKHREIFTIKKVSARKPVCNFDGCKIEPILYLEE